MDKLDSIEVNQILENRRVTSVKDLDGQLADADVLYRIGRGEASASQLMDALSKIWPKDAIDRTARQLIGWLTEHGYLPSIQFQISDAERAERERISNLFIQAVEKLCEQARISKKDWPWYAEKIGSLVSGDQAIIQRVAEGNLADIEERFAIVHSQATAQPTRLTQLN
jgi:hypothetical protein